MSTEILIIDDDQDDVDFLEHAFSTIAEVSVVSFLNYFDAIKYLKTSERSPSLLITDYNMPNITGFNLATYIKRNEAFSSIPVVVLTGTIDEAEKVRLMHAGVLKICTKPNDIDGYVEIAKELLQMVNRKNN